MKIIIALTLALSTSILSAALPEVIAGPIRNPANNHLYFLLDAATWTESEARAISMGGHLVTINSVAENNWVVDTFGSFGEMNRHLWIGLTDREQEDVFRWASGERFIFANWNGGEPNNSGGGGYEEDFVYIIAGSEKGVWNDVPDDGAGVGGPLYGVVEIQPSVLRPPVFRFNHPSNVRPGGLRPRKF